MTTVSNFNWQRFRLVVLHQFHESRGLLVNFLLGGFIALFVMYLFTGYFMIDFEFVDLDTWSTFAAVYTYMAIVTMLHIGYSLIFSHLKTKQARINFYMLPATNAEKYFARLLLTSLGSAVLILVAFVAADLLSWALLALMQRPGAMVMPVIGDHISKLCGLIGLGINKVGDTLEIHEVLFMIPFGLSSLVTYHAIYVLGGTVFRKFAFLLTTAFNSAVSIVLSIPFSIIAAFFTNWEAIIHWINEIPFHIWLSIGSLVNLLFAALFYWISYRMFVRSNVITSRSIGL
ncbi:MAG: hypothetical protein HUK09_07950 [Bacteroidaceae bacterium]|nr:hypothetical protein [Bacteroidaceae bacterium]